MTNYDPTIDELTKQQTEEIYPDLCGDAYVDAMLQDIYDEVTSQY